jgi:hypothetical protein
MFVSMLFLFPFLIGHFKKVERSRWKYLMLAGLCGNGIPAVLFPLAETEISSALAGMINSTVPIFTLILGVLFFQMKSDKTKLIGIFIGYRCNTFCRCGGSEITEIPIMLTRVITCICYAVSVTSETICWEWRNSQHRISLCSQEFHLNISFSLQICRKNNVFMMLFQS